MEPEPRHVRGWRVRAVPLVLAAGLFAGSGIVSSVNAAAGCRSDPLVAFSNGITVDLHAAIGTDLSSVQHITYVLHGPKDGSTYTATYPDGTGTISSLTYVADSQPHQYYASVTVTTGKAPVAVSAYLDWTAGGKHNSGTAQNTGATGSPVVTAVLKVVCANACS